MSKTVFPTSVGDKVFKHCHGDLKLPVCLNWLLANLNSSFYFFKTSKAVHKSQWSPHPLSLSLLPYCSRAQLPRHPKLLPSTRASSQSTTSEIQLCCYWICTYHQQWGPSFRPPTASHLKGSSQVVIAQYFGLCKCHCWAAFHRHDRSCCQRSPEAKSRGPHHGPRCCHITPVWSWSKPMWSSLAAAATGVNGRARVRKATQEFWDIGGSASSWVSTYKTLSGHSEHLLEPK